MYRVVNLDMGGEVIQDGFTSIEQAKKCQEDHYYFMTGIEQKRNGKWIRVNGILEELAEIIPPLTNKR
jgi:hypothetical protein